MALRTRFYGDPANTVDEVRRVARQMQGCDKCEHGDKVFGMKVCLATANPDADGYCARWLAKAGDNKKGAE